MSSSEAPANIRVLVRVRPINEREAKFNSTSVLDIDDGGMTSAIDFGMGDNGNGDDRGQLTIVTGTNNSNSSSQGTISIVDQSAAAGGYGSGYDSGANSAALAANNNSNNYTARSFTYDAVFGPKSEQVQIYDSVKGIIDAVCAGYNGTVVAYGQTGSGKTWTIFGDDGDLQDNPNAGLVQRSLKSIFAKISQQSLMSPTSSAAAASGVGTIRTTTKASFFEIYNERVYDLLSPNMNPAEDDKGLLVREDASRGVYVEGLIQTDVSNTREAMEILRRGMDNRSVAATKMNRVSSRSHAMFVLTVKSEYFTESGISKVRVSKFTLVDLAGSERQKATATDGERLKEASMINNSLLCLGQVINSLVDREKGKQSNHVPFRDSKLTFLLRDSWGGNSKTCLVATVSPSVASLSETMSTLKFAQRAKLVKNTAVLNENTCGSVAALQAEIARLRAELELKNESMASDAPSLDTKQSEPATTVTVSALRNQNSKLNKKVKVLKDVSNHRDTVVNHLKRKLQQEMMLSKCKERRLNYLSSKVKASGGTEDDSSEEVAALTQEVAILRERLEAQPSESVEWMLKWKEEKARVEEMEADSTNTFEASEKTELEASLVQLLDERESLQQKMEKMSEERNTEIDAIIQDVTKLENSNIVLQSQLEKNAAEIKAKEDEIQSNKAQFGELEKEMETTLDCLESTQSELAAEKKRIAELQESMNSMKIEAHATVTEYQGKVAAAGEELKELTEKHNQSTTALNTRITELQQNLTVAMGDNESLIKKLKEASDDLESKKSQLQGLEKDKNEALLQLEKSEEKNTTDLKSFELKEEALRAEIEALEEAAGSLLAEKAQATTNLVNVTAQNNLLSGEMKELKAERDDLQQRVASLEKLRDDVANLEDEVAFVTIEKEQAERQLELTQADLERTTRLQQHLNQVAAAALDDDLARCDEIITSLSREKSTVQEDLTKVSQQLVENSEQSEGKIALLEAELSKMRDHASGLEADVARAEAAAEALRSEKAQTAEQLEQVNDSLKAHKEKIESLRGQREELRFTLNEKTTELQMDLSMAVSEKETLAKKLKSSTDDLEAQKTLIAELEHDKFDAQKQLELSQEKSNADRELFNIHEENFKAEIKKAEETIQSLLSEKAEAISSLENSAAQIKELQDCITTLERDAQKKQEAVEALSSEKAQTAEQLEKVTKQSVEMSEEVNALTSERDALQLTTEARISEMQASLDAAMNEKEALGEELKVASNGLEAKKAEIESLDRDRSEALKKLQLSQEKNATDKESFRLQEEALRAEIKTAEDKIQSIQSEKDEAISSLEIAKSQNEELQNRIATLEGDISKVEEAAETLKSEKAEAVEQLETVTAQSVMLSDEVESLKSERHSLQLTTEAKLSEMQSNLDAAMNDKASMTEKLKEAVDDLEAKKAELKSMEHDKSEALTELELSRKRSESDKESFRLQEEILRAEIKKVEDAVESLESGKAEATSRLEHSTAQNKELRDRITTLEGDAQKKEQAAEALRSEKAYTEEQLEKVTAQSVALSEEVKALTSERDTLQLTTETKLSEMQSNVDSATNEKASLSEKLKVATNDLDAKKIELETLEHDKSEALTELELSQERSEADKESFRLQEEILRAEIKKAEDAVESLESEKAEAHASLEKVEEQNFDLTEEVKALKLERDGLQQQIKSVAGLEDEVERITTEKSQLAERVTQCDGVIDKLNEEKSSLENDLEEVTQQSNAKVKEIQNELEQKEKELRSELDSAKMSYDQSVRDAAEREAEFNTKISEAESAKDVAVKELEDIKAILAESEGIKEELESERAKVNELEECVKTGEAVKTELDAVKEEKVALEAKIETQESNEEALKARIESLEKENAAMREKTFQDPPSSSSSSIPSPKSSPIQPFDEKLLPNENAMDSTFGDDSFDEAMFLPNVEEEANLNNTLDMHGGESTTPQTDENKTPSQTPFKEKRALFSPLSTKASSKKPKKKTQTHTPAKRMTRRSTRLLAKSTPMTGRTPLGKSKIQNTPLSSSRKVRTNWNGKSMF